MPFVAGVSQVRSNPGLGHDAAHCAMRTSLHPGATSLNKCDAVVDPVGNPPPPPPPPPVSPPPTCSVTAPSNSGTLTIDGKVALFVAPYTRLANWCVQLTGTVTATALTDASGNYMFGGLPDGTYTVCEVLQTGWQQMFPTDGAACPSGLGWTFTLEGFGGSFLDFKNVPTP